MGPVSEADAKHIPSLLRDLDSRMAPGGEIKKSLAKLALACRVGQSDGVDRRAQAALFTEYLAEYPASIVSEAVDEWIKTKVFWPAVSEIRGLCDDRMKKWRIAHLRLRLIAEATEKAAAEAERDRELAASKNDPVQQAKIAELMAGWRSRHSGGSLPQPRKVTPHHVELSDEERERLLRKRQA